MSKPHSSLFDALQAEFSPPLDSSLIAAIIADYDISSADDQIQPLRDVLSQLAAQAEKELVDEDILSEQFSNVQISSYSITDDTTSSHDFFSPNSSNTASSSTSDSSSQHSFSSPLGFLQAAFPHVPANKLRSALSNADDTESLDMESVVEGLLSSEYVRELEERGLDGLDPEEMDEEDWMIVEGKRRKPSTPPSKPPKKSKKRGTTFTLVDIRQKQHERPPPASPRAAPPDPWTQLSSVASYLSTLLPSHSAAYFQSAFHSPEYSSPAKALRAVLSNIASSPSSSSSDSDPNLHSEHSTMLFAMFDVLRASPEYAELNAEERDQVMEDGQLTLKATHGQPDRAIDLVWLLQELERDSISGEYDWGVYHSPAPARPPPAPNVANPARSKLPTGPPAVGPPPRGRATSPVSPRQTRNSTPSPNAWKTIPQRPPAGPHPLAAVIPAYRKKVRGSGNGLGKGGKGDVGELSTKLSHTRRMHELMVQRQDMLRQAGRAWQKGNAKTHGGEVAFYYAERARDLQQQARREKLNVAKEMVQAKRMSSTYGDAVDLHGTTVAEAVAIVKDVLRESGSTQVKPLRIITGRGTHSTNGVGVLGPAVKSALEEDGWMVRRWDGGLVVCGRNAWRS
ncbi:uncharacterized protein C8Q71DRAFT_855375 [Rhodofomes roseus]|uniref:Smr domain-containing protein n=1 Tax=Rhodofomes roseus TaxID=34475 RepID=A0ABQ8KQW0_9APHY|nr:uncharacterized protein C8Q71DRAFT_855375 [Rhodofomes roseus]KAH9840080.1 hypothetical protein C8Q71DRAFT_855375 [Rhodofomes roseus]